MIRRVATVLIALLLVVACEESDDPIRIPRTLPLTRDDTVLVNVQIVAEALARYAADNAGEYPAGMNPDFIDYLPEGQRVSNPFTGERSEPCDWDCDLDASRGQIVYQPQGLAHEGYPYPYPGYTLRGYGKRGLIAELEVGADSLFGRDDAVIANCLAVRDAAEQFALRNGGAYPSDLADRDEDGDTVVDLLPEGRMLLNPYHLCHCEPQNGVAAQPGQTGYLPITDGTGRYVGYMITGWGGHCEIVLLMKDPTP